MGSFGQLKNFSFLNFFGCTISIHSEQSYKTYHQLEKVPSCIIFGKEMLKINYIVSKVFILILQINFEVLCLTQFSTVLKNIKTLGVDFLFLHYNHQDWHFSIPYINC
jgi:hypothetical protein